MDRHVISRREALRRGGRLGAGVALGSLLAACGVSGTAERTESDPDATLPPLAKELLIAQWPLYIDKKTVSNFEKSSGIDVTYKEVINDNAEFFATIREPLAAGQQVEWDLITLSDWLVAKMSRLGFLETFDHSLLPNVTKHMGEEFRNPPYDPGNKHSIPWQGGITGVAYNRELVGRELTTFEDLWDPALEGHVGMMTEMVDTMSLTMLMQGVDLANAAVEDAEAAAAKLIEQREAGIVRSYYGNDYLEPLARGDLWASMAWSGDIFWLAQDEPDVTFYVPEEGGVLWATPMEIPRGAAHPRDAHAFMDYVYDPEVAADITSWVGYITPVPEVQEVLLERAKSAKDPSFLKSLASSPYVFPTEEMKANVHSYKVLSEEEETAYNELFSEVVQG